VHTQWVEESFTNFEQGINWRSYVVCDVAYNNVNNWLWTPFIERRDANRIYIEIKFSMRDCNLFPGTWRFLFPETAVMTLNQQL
jgi:ephrin-B